MSEFQPTTPAMKKMLYTASLLVFIVGIPLFLLPTETETYFAWTIKFPLTAAFLGAAYWSSFLLEFLAARENSWARSAIAAPAVFIFTILTFMVTVVHIDRFHFDSSFPMFTQIGTVVWLGVYLIVPLLLGGMLYEQSKQTVKSEVGNAPLTPWLRYTLFFQAFILINVGIIFLLVPSAASGIWAWKLPALAARAVGAWLIGIGVAAGHLFGINDYVFGRVGFISYFSFAALQLINIIRFASTPLPGRDVPAFDWGGIRGWGYILFLISIIIVSIYGLWKQQTINQQSQPAD